MLVETRPTRRFDFLANEKFWAWGLAIIFALGAIVALLALKPVTRFDYSAAELTSAVPDKIEYGFYQVETGDTGQKFRWMSDKARLIFPVNSNQSPIKITFTLRSGRSGGNPASPVTTVTLNGVKLGDLQPGLEYQQYSFNLKPPYTDDHRLNFRLDTTPTFSPPGDERKFGNIIQSASIDLSEVWSPLQQQGWLVWFFPAVALGTLVLLLISRSKAALANPAGYGAVTLSVCEVVLSLFWLLLLSRVGYNGNANGAVFWLWTVSAAYLVIFFGWVALDGLSWGKAGQPTLWAKLRGQFTPWALAHPAFTALIGFFVVNAAITGLFYAKVYFETGSLDPIVRYWDGPEYLVIANGFYDKYDPLLRIPDFGQHSENYWTAHFPGYSLALRLVWYAVGWMAAGPVVNFVASSLFAFVFWKFLRDFGYAARPFWLATVSLVLPVRWLIYHSVGASEPLMLLFQMLSIYYFKKERYWLAGLAGALALFVRPPGIFLWFGYLLFLVWEAGQKIWQEKKFQLNYLNWKAFWGLLPIPLTVPLVFGLYAWRYGDFLAYFHITENVTHVEFWPFPSLAGGADPGSGIFYYYLIEATGLVLLWKQRRIDLLCIGFGTFLYTVFLLHPDVLRYALPAFPLIVAIPFARYLSGKTARWLAIPVLLMIYLYSWGALNDNLAALDTWQMMKDILR